MAENSLSIPQPPDLEEGFWIPRKDLPRTWVFIKYERLQGFCYHCGVIGQDNKKCNKSQAMATYNPSKPRFRLTLGVPLARSITSIMAKHSSRVQKLKGQDDEDMARKDRATNSRSQPQSSPDSHNNTQQPMNYQDNRQCAANSTNSYAPTTFEARWDPHPPSHNSQFTRDTESEMKMPVRYFPSISKNYPVPTLAIPTSLYQSPVLEEYSVKIGYHLAKEQVQINHRPSSSHATSPDLWKAIWDLKTPQKDIWKSRNNFVLRNQKLNHISVINQTEARAREYHNITSSNPQSTSNNQSGVRRNTGTTSVWRPPPPGILKCNVHARWDPQRHFEAIGIILRDVAGQTQGGVAKGVHAQNPQFAEALAVREEKVREIATIIQDILIMKSSFDFCGFTRTSREGNEAANVIPSHHQGISPHVLGPQPASPVAQSLVEGSSIIFPFSGDSYLRSGIGSIIVRLQPVL
ncbi:Zinc knuckle CX2CX4HX4C [Sesbania bispinosa]|nr:Zinc knuckle CX2CX4HX4C [Sesbania bispinosa]